MQHEKKLKLPRGLQARVARKLGVAAATVCQVAAGTRTSAPIMAAIERELARLKRKLPAGAEAA